MAEVRIDAGAESVRARRTGVKGTRRPGLALHPPLAQV
jgi:hypothetical protein